MTRRLSIILFILLVVVCLGINVDKNFYPKLNGDAVSAVLMAKAPSMGLGVPYKDFWEYKPPGIFLLLDFWIKIFSSSMFSLRTLQLLFFFGTGILAYLISKKIFSSFHAFIISGLAAIVLFSPYLANSFLPAELFGLFFSLAGVASLFYFRNLALRFSVSSFFFFISGQMKDPFMLTILALVPSLAYFLMIRDYRSFMKAVLYLVSGILLGIFLILGYLSISGSLRAYFEVLSAKSQIFNGLILLRPGEIVSITMNAFWHAKNIIIFLQYQTIPILLIWTFSFFVSLILQKKLNFLRKKEEKSSKVVISLSNFEISPRAIETLTVVFYSLGSFMGFALGNKYDFHYLLQIVFPIYFIMAIVIKSTADNLVNVLGSKATKILSSTLIIVFLFPKGAYVKSYRTTAENPRQVVNNISNHLVAGDVGIQLENYINSKIDENSCILSVYGWSTGETYLNAIRRPCTRFFLANIVLKDWQEKEYRDSILNNPPAAIIYATAGADMNVKQFEEEVINLTKIIDRCYVLDPLYTKYSFLELNLYFPSYSHTQLQTCVKQNYL